MLAETTEIFGAEHLLVRRARNRAVAEKLLGFVKGYKQYLNRCSAAPASTTIPTPGNKEGGLTNILEKVPGRDCNQIGHVSAQRCGRLRGTRPHPRLRIHEHPGVRSYFADPRSGRGRRERDRAFTTGRGSAIGFPTVPVIKIASNSNTYGRMRDNMDAERHGRIADGETTVAAEVGHEIFRSCFYAWLRASARRASAWAITNSSRGASGPVL